ncbi:MAG: HAD-IIB family hydrolase [Metamycoplasmataceae bacterium]
MHRSNINKGGATISSHEEQNLTPLNDSHEYIDSKLFVFDLEGILLNRFETIDENIIKEMEKIHEGNHLIAIVTNRSYKESLKYIEKIKTFVSFFIGNNGAVLVDTLKGELLKTPKTINLEFINNIIRDVKLLGGAVQIITSKKIYIDSYINFLKSDDWLSNSVKESYILPFKNYIRETTVKKSEVIQLTVIMNPDLIGELLNYFKKFYHSNYDFKLSSNITLDINVAGVNKYEGIRTIIMLYKLKKENIFCFGDSFNDIELMKNIHNTYAKETSVLEIKELAKTIIDVGEKNTLSLEIRKILKK